MNAPLRLSLLAVLVASISACGADDPGVAPPADAAPGDPDATAGGPYDDVELSRLLQFDELSGPVHIARDELGIAHIHAENLADVFFAQGYVAAHDRLPQMDLLRRSGAGTLSELFGTATLEQDLEMRMHMMKPIAEAAMAELRASADPRDAAIVEMLDRYTAGVNAYAEALAAGAYDVHDAIAETWDPERFVPWTPSDSLVLGRLMAFDLSYQAPRVIADSLAFDALFATFGAPDGADPAVAARAGAHADLLRIQPIGRVATIDGVPGYDAGATSVAAKELPRRPRPSRELLDRALTSFSMDAPAIAARPYRDPNAGSNSWVVSPSVTGGETILAGDQHLQLRNPSIFYPTHLIVPNELNVEGITFPGVPGIVLGHNGKVAWSSTTVRHDVTDVYLEEIIPCADGGGDCVRFDGGEVPIEVRKEEVRIGALGTIIETREYDYEVVPHHGPIIPTLEGGDLVPRTASEALSVRYTGYGITHEIRAFFDLMTTQNVDEALDALETFQFGGQNFMFIDDQGNIGWSIHAEIPLRSPAAYTFHAIDNPEGLAPWLILPGDGTAEWEGFLSTEQIPRVKNPEQGYLATANSDLFGLTFDGDPLNGPEIEGRPLYFNAFYAVGLRTARIVERILQRIDADEPVSLADTIDTQHDTRSNFGAQLMPRLTEIFGLLDDGDRPADVQALLDDLGEERVAAMRAGADILSSWSLATPAAVGPDASSQEIDDSAATVLLNAWMHFFVQRALDDELQAAGLDGAFSIVEETFTRTAVALLVEPDTLASGLADETQQPILCDDLTTEDLVESCDRIALEALDLAVQWAASEEGFGTDDASQWRWGERHTLTLAPLAPSPELTLGPFARAGESGTVNVASTTFRDLTMRQRPSGPAQRFIAWGVPGSPLRAKFQLPGGTVYDPRSRFYRNLLDDAYLPEVHADMPFTREEIVAAGVERWLLAP
jgi:penicillin G amidase